MQHERDLYDGYGNLKNRPLNLYALEPINVIVNIIKMTETLNETDI